MLNTRKSIKLKDKGIVFWYKELYKISYIAVDKGILSNELRFNRMTSAAGYTTTILKNFTMYKTTKTNSNYVKHNLTLTSIKQISTTPTIFAGSYNVINYLRKSLTFTKVKLSRNRQICENIVYLGLLLNILFINELHRAFYGLSINYTAIFLNLLIPTIMILIVKIVYVSKLC